MAPETSDAELGAHLSSDHSVAEEFARRAATMPVHDLPAIVAAAGDALGARSARLLVSDYAVLSLHELGAPDPAGQRLPIEGTLAGHAFAKGEVTAAPQDPDAGPGPVTVWVPITQDSERVGVLELELDSWTGSMTPAMEAVVRTMVLLLLSKRRYTDTVLRSRRSEPLSVAAEVQWDLLPPLSCFTDEVTLTGMLEPAYSIGGDSFDYALNPGVAEFAIVDAVGHGMPAVLMSVIAINSLRNARRDGRTLEDAYLRTGDLIESEFGASSFVTGHIGTLDLETGSLRWLNAGHPPPLLVRDGRYIGEMRCKASLPMGLGGLPQQIATEHLQGGDRVLFYTDGVTETRSATGEPFGLDRLADYVVRATLDHVHPTETVRRLSASIVRYNGVGLSDDATLLLIEYRGRSTGNATRNTTGNPDG